MKRVLLLLSSLLLAAGCGSHFGPPLIAPVTTVWTVPLDGPPEGPIGTDGKSLFATAKEEGLVSVNLETGKTVWSLEDGHGLLAVRTNLLVLRKSDGTTIGMNPENGKTLWTAETGVHGTIAPVLDGNRVFVAGEGIAAIDAATGEVAWKQESEVVTTPPAVALGRVLVGEADGVLRCRDRETGKSLWTISMANALLAPPTLNAAGRVFLGGNDRRVRALSLKDGAEVWSRRIGADVDTAPVVYGKSILLATEEGILYCLTQKNGDILWRAALPSRPMAPPVLLGTAVLVPCREHIKESNAVAFDVKTGRRVHFFPDTTGEALFSLLYGDRLYVAGRAPNILGCLRLNVMIGPQLPAPSGAPSRRTKPAF